jgi:hypothetical protein
MHVNAPLLSYVPDHLFLHGPRLFFEVGYEAIFSCLKHLAGGPFGPKLKEVLLNIIYSGRATVNLFSDCRRSPMKC